MFDLQKGQVGGQVLLHVDDSTAGSRVSLSFTESAEFISPSNSDDSCRSVSSMDGDGVQSLPMPLSQGQFQQTISQQRGGFRFLTIVSNSEAPVSISNVGVHNTFMPHWDDLTAYTGYFFTRDPDFHDPDFLTKLWYAGAYTVQTNTIDVHLGSTAALSASKRVRILLAVCIRAQCGNFQDGLIMPLEVQSRGLSWSTVRSVTGKVFRDSYMQKC